MQQYRDEAIKYQQAQITRDKFNNMKQAMFFKKELAKLQQKDSKKEAVMAVSSSIRNLNQ